MDNEFEAEDRKYIFVDWINSVEEINKLAVMMKIDSDQIDIVLQYLKIETNYAIIINGQYGIGKTHFYKNQLVPKIKETSLLKDERKKFTPIHISLFGFKSLEEIQTAIFIELFPKLKNRGLKLAAGIGKLIIRGIAQLNQAGDIDKYMRHFIHWRKNCEMKRNFF